MLHDSALYKSIIDIDITRILIQDGHDVHLGGMKFLHKYIKKLKKRSD